MLKFSAQSFVLSSALALSLVLVGCQPQNLSPTGATPTNNALANIVALNPASRQPAQPAKSYPALTKTDATGSVSITGQTLTLTLQLPELPVSTSQNFTTQLLDLSNATKLFAQVTDSHGETYTPVGADGNGAVNYTGGTITLTFNNVVPDELLFVEVQAKDGTSDIPQADLATVLKHTASASPVNTTLNFQTTVAARAMKRLLTAQSGNPANPDRARAINLNDLESFTRSITGVTGTAPALTYLDNHPTLVNINTLADALQTTDANALSNPASFRQSGATLTLNVSGLNGTDKIQVQSTDAASAVKTDLANGTHTITGATPGTGIKILASAFGTPAQAYSYTPTPATVTLTEGNTQVVNIVAAPALSVASFSPAAGPAGTAVVISGTGFTGATAVSFNGTPAASFTVDSNTQITATVPAGAIEGPISVTNNGTVNSNTSFDVQRRMYVNQNATGNNNGTSWANAYSSLQTAMTAAGANDEIWIAAGTYTPHASDRDVAFNMKQNVNIYGGFAGTENALTDRTASLTDFVTILSGDLSGNDNYTTPGTTLDENAYHVIEGASNATLDGVTIQGGNADSGTFPNDRGGGMYNAGSSPILTNITFSNNTATNRGGGMSNFSSSPTLTNVTFSDNAATIEGGGMSNLSSSPTLTNVTFSNNAATNLGGGMSNSVSSPILTNVMFSNNAATDGGGMLNSSSGPILTDVTFSNNAADEGGGMFNSSSDPTLTDVTFSGNSATDGGGMYNNRSEPTLTGVTFSGNSATNGGGMHNDSSGPILTGVTFSGNSATDGGGMHNASSEPTLTGVTFLSNSATNFGGGMNNSSSSSATLTNVTFLSNSAERGGGINSRINFSSDLMLTNVTFSNNAATGNAATGWGGGIYHYGIVTLINATFSNNSAAYGSGIYHDGLSTELTLINVLFWNSILRTPPNNPDNAAVIEATVDPFVNAALPNGPDGIPRTADDGLRISPSATEVLNAGVNPGSYSQVPTTDIIGNPRPGTSNANAEPGAYEFTP